MYPDVKYVNLNFVITPKVLYLYAYSRVQDDILSLRFFKHLLFSPVNLLMFFSSPVRPCYYAYYIAVVCAHLRTDVFDRNRFPDVAT